MEKVLVPLFERYEKLMEQVEKAFNDVCSQFPQEVKCKLGCSDCCHALFDLTLIEALYIHHHFMDKVSEPQRGVILDRANRADRDVYRLKRKAFNALKEGTSEAQVLEQIAQERVRCSLLNEENRCVLYAHRPATCRLYGIPTAIGGKGHTCGLSGFEQGKAYPTANVDPVQEALYSLSMETARAIRSRYARLAEMLVPLSMALLNPYDEEYLGVGDCRQGGVESLELAPAPERKKGEGGHRHG